MPGVKNEIATAKETVPLSISPDDNAPLVLTYNNAALFSTLGRMGVLGDLRTEYLKEEELRSKLKSQPRASIPIV